MKQFYLIFVSAFISANLVQSQDSSYLLQQYKFRTPGFRALQLNVNAAGNFADAKRINSDDRKINQLNSAFQLEYLRIISTEKRQHQSSIQLNPAYNQTRIQNGSDFFKNRNLNLQANWNRIDRFYNSKNFFFDIGNELSVGGGRQKNTSNSQTDVLNNNSISNKLIIGAGKGRIENVQDAQMALFIVNDLRRSGLLQKEPDAATMYELAVLLTDINNRRIFDNRIRRKYELTRIDSFFQSKQLITTPSIAYFTTVNDNWALAFNPGRLRGTRLFVRMNPGLNFNHEITNRTDSAVNLFKYNSKTLSLFFEPEIGIEHHKPAGLQWQQNGSVSIRIPYFFTRQNSRVETPSSVSAYKNVFSAPQFILNSFYGFGYYPNNRTIINAGLNFQAIFGELYAGIVNRDYYILSPGAQLNADYFINFRTRLFLSASLNYRYTGFRDQYPSFMVVDKNVLFGNFNFGLSHFIF